MSNEPVQLTRDGHVALLRIDSPETRNALSPAVLGAIVDGLDSLAGDPDVRAVVLAGSERAFASGADIRAMIGTAIGDDYFQLRRAQWRAVWQFPLPLVAAVSGYCLGGGCELALGCDVIVASETALFGLPETKLGLIPGAGGTQRLVRAIGKATAMDVVLSGRRLSAVEALGAGLIARVAPPESWLDAALDVGRDIADSGPQAVRLAKRSILNAFERPLPEGLDEEWSAFEQAFDSEEAREGLTAFTERRDPSWRSQPAASPDA